MTDAPNQTAATGGLYGPFWSQEFGLHYLTNIPGHGMTETQNQTALTAEDFRAAAQTLRCACEVAAFEELSSLACEEIAKMLDMKAATMDPEWSPL